MCKRFAWLEAETPKTPLHGHENCNEYSAFLSLCMHARHQDDEYTARIISCESQHTASSADALAWLQAVALPDHLPLHCHAPWNVRQPSWN
jgi:hypothetical protein